MNETEKAEEQAIAQRELMLLELQLADDFRDIMNTVPGRRFLWHFLAELHCYAPTFDMNHAVMAFKEGERNVGLKLLGRVNSICPELYEVMRRENTIRNQQE